MKNPKWMDSCPKYVCHPASTLKQASNVIEACAKIHKGGIEASAYHAMIMVSKSLKEVAEGMAWAEAFELNEAISCCNEGESK